MDFEAVVDAIFDTKHRRMKILKLFQVFKPKNMPDSQLLIYYMLHVIDLEECIYLFHVA